MRFYKRIGLFIVVGSVIIFFKTTESKKSKVVYFEKIGKKIDILKKEKPSYNYHIINYNKPIKTINLIEEKYIPIFTTKESNYPNIYGFDNKFLINFNDDVVIFDKKKIIDSVINNSFGYNKVATYKDRAYIFLNNKFFVYDKNGFRKIPIKFDFHLVHKIFVDTNNIYIKISPKQDDELLVLNKNLKDYSFYKIIHATFDIIPIGAKNNYIYFKDENLTIKAISLDNKIKTITSKRFFARFKDFYILKEKDTFNLYQFPKKLITTFKTKLKFHSFFILKNHIYLKEVETVLAKLNLNSNKIIPLNPTRISYYFDINSNFIAFAKNNTIKILDENLTKIKEYKINVLSNVYEKINYPKSNIKIKKLFNFITIVDFGDKKIIIFTVDGFFEQYTLKDYAIFRAFDEKDKVLVIKKDKIFKLKLVSNHNKIYRLKPLKNNKFLIIDGFGKRIVVLDKLDRTASKH